MPVTIKDIAAEAGVSYQAVSAVLNGKTNCRVSPARREHILSIAREMGYRTNFGYKLMHGRSTRTVAIVSAMRQIESDEHVRRLIIALMQRLNQQGFATYFNNRMAPDGGENLLQIQDLIARGTEHFIFIGSPVGHEEIERKLIANRRTFIGWNSFFSRDLHTDSESASLRLFQFLREKSGEIPLLLLPGRRRVSSLRFSAMRKLCGDIPEEEVIRRYVVFVPAWEWDEKDFSARAFELGYKGTADIFAGGRRPRAIASYTDPFALGAAAWCQEHGVTVGRDIFLSGFNNNDGVRFGSLPIASAEHPVFESIDILLEEMTRTEPFRHTIPLKVFCRPTGGR